MITATILYCLIISSLVTENQASWEDWWTYDGISGPEYWGRINPEWSLCNKGRRQSPINVEPHKLLYDPYLRLIEVDKYKVSGTLLNTGQSLVFRVDKDTKHHINITGGPLAYRYQFEEFYIHYGIVNQHGSEHKIHGYSFPGEIQLYGFNAELYHNMTEAQHKSQGIVGISLMVQIGETPNPELRIITSSFNKVMYKGAETPIRHLSLRSLMPDTEHYMTYEGSTTHPGCWETTVWIILNKPIYITKQELYALRKLMQGSEKIPKAPLGNNARPLQPLHHRTVRTNIDFQNSQSLTEACLYRCSNCRVEPTDKQVRQKRPRTRKTKNQGLNCNVIKAEEELKKRKEEKIEAENQLRRIEEVKKETQREILEMEKRKQFLQQLFQTQRISEQIMLDNFKKQKENQFPPTDDVRSLCSTSTFKDDDVRSLCSTNTFQDFSRTSQENILNLNQTWVNTSQECRMNQAWGPSNRTSQECGMNQAWGRFTTYDHLYNTPKKKDENHG